MAGVLPPSWGSAHIAHLQKEIRAEVEGIIKRIQPLMDPTSPNVTIPDLLVLEEDLNRTCKHIGLCTLEGHTWGHRAYGCTKTEMTAWRVLVRETLEELRNHNSKLHNANFVAKENNSESCKVPWPEEINSLTWQNFFMLWMRERESFTCDWQRCAHLKSALTPLDRERLAPLTSPDSRFQISFTAKLMK